MTAIPAHPSTFTEVDALGRQCPWPLVLAKQALKAMLPGGELRVLTDDPMAEMDLRALCERDGHAFLGVERISGSAAETFVLRIVKAG